MNKPDHSDFLIHWTGHDIDADPQYQIDHTTGKTTINKKEVKPYLERLKFILRHGLWMTVGDEYVECKGQKIIRPVFSRTCFTELKLSEAEVHAQRFGRLGIGFKRMFICERMGCPMIYFRPEKDNWLLSPALWASSPKGNAEIKEYWACFLKSMHEDKQKAGEYVDYQQFEESEWRIIFSKEIGDHLTVKGSQYCQYFKTPDQIQDPEFQAFLKAQKTKPQYLISLRDNPNNPKSCARWFAMIIYPSLAVKVAAEADEEIRQEIERLKPRAASLDGLTTSATYECFSKPFEMNLSSCRNF